jgi:hypothetical protein
MDWLSYLVELLVEDVLKLSIGGRVGASLHFFIYDIIKVFLILSSVIFIIFLYRVTFHQRERKEFWVI